MEKQNGTHSEDKFTEEDLYGLVVLIAIGLFLSFHIPGWIAAYFGWTKGLAIIVAWIKARTLWLSFFFLLLYGLSGAFVLFLVVAVVFGIGYGLFELVKLLCKGLIAVLRYIGPLLYKGLCAVGGLVLWPFTATYRSLSDHFEERRAIRAEEQELRRMYREEYADDFRSFREFKRYWDAVASGEAPPRNQRKKQEQQKEKMKEQKKEEYRPPPDTALEEAIRLLKLPKSFSLEKLERHYRKLMSKAHPDRGGSAKRAAQLNQARHLIKERRGWT